jgi:hypothetical protein
LVLTLLCAAPATAQDRLIQLGWLWELSGTELTRLRPMPLIPDYPGAVVVAGSGYVLAPLPSGPATAALGYLDVVAGTQGLVPGVSLESPYPVLAKDPWRPRVFIWHGNRISEFSASAGLRDVITGLPELPYGSLRQMAYSAAADALAFVRHQTPFEVDEIVVARGTTGEELRRIPLAGRVVQLAADPQSSRLIVTLQPPAPALNQTVHVLGLPDGALTTLPYTPPSWVYGGPVIDSTNHRLLFSWGGGVLATDDNLVVLGELNTGSPTRQITSVLGVSASTGRTFVQSFFGGGTYIPPGPCLLHEVERTGQALAPIDLSARLGRQEGRCDAGILLTVPGPAGTPAATVSGADVTLSWQHPGNVEHFELEAQAGGTVRLFELGIEPRFDASGVPAGTYLVRVRGRNAIGVGPWSGVAVVVVTPGSGQLPTVRAIVQ